MHGSLAYSSQSLASDGALFRVAVDLGGGGNGGTLRVAEITLKHPEQTFVF